VPERCRDVERPGRRAVDVERDAALAEHRGREVGDRDVNVRVAEVDPDRRAGRRVEAQLHGRAPAAAAVAGAGLDHEAAHLQVGHQRGDGRAREAGGVGDLAAARVPAAAQRLHDPQAVQLPQILERPHFTTLSHPCVSVKGANEDVLIGA
jgi:hypothetical protein